MAILKKILRYWRYGPSLVIQKEPGSLLLIEGYLRRGYPRSNIRLAHKAELNLASNAIINIGSDIAVSRSARLTIGARSYINVGTFIRCEQGISIGADCLVGRSVEFRDTDGHGYVENSPISIGDRVWIGDRAMILNGTVIGADSIVGAGAVVPGGVYPPNSLIVGNPAVVKKTGIRLDPNAPSSRNLLPFNNPSDVEHDRYGSRAV